MMTRHVSQLMIRRVKRLRLRDFSQAVVNSIYDKSHYMEEYIKNIYMTMKC
jgi:hypothetical protein